jgi:hypothetical protein
MSQADELRKLLDTPEHHWVREVRCARCPEGHAGLMGWTALDAEGAPLLYQAVRRKRRPDKPNFMIMPQAPAMRQEGRVLQKHVPVASKLKCLRFGHTSAPITAETLEAVWRGRPPGPIFV